MQSIYDYGKEVTILELSEEAHGEIDELYRKDNMKRSEFYKFVTSAKHFLSLKNELESENSNMQNMICN